MSKTKDVNLTRAVKPKFITLAKRPANQVGFKVLRNDNGEQTMSNRITRTRTNRRSDSTILAISFPDGTTEEEARETLDGYGLSGYEIKAEGSLYVAYRSDAPEDAQTVDVKLDGGETATILKPVAQRTDGQQPNIAVVSIEFGADYFPEPEDVSAWMKANDVDFSGNALENGDQGTVVRRAESVPEEVRRIEVDSGITFVVARADEASIPHGYEAVISDAAYGNWGWGHLDFAAAMADKEFCKIAEDATYMLRNVCDRILFYSELPLATRKTLIAEAAGQYAAFVGSLLDALPKRAVVAARRSDPHEENTMSKTAGKKEDEVKREDATEAKTDETVDTGAAVTRADVEEMIATAMGGVTTSLDEIKAALVTRSDKAEEEQVETPKAVTLEDVMRSVEAVGASVKAIEGRVTEIEGSTVTRSDDTDAEQTEKRTDVFAGVFSNKKPQ